MKKLALASLLLLALSTQAMSEECTSKLQEFVNSTGYTIKVAKPCTVWMATDALSIPRGEGVTGLLLIAQEGDIGIVGAVVQPKANLNLSADLLLKMLQLNNDVDFVKVGIDSDGDLFVRSELRMASLTDDELKDTVNRVVQATSKVYDVVKQ